MVERKYIREREGGREEGREGESGRPNSGGLGPGGKQM